MPERLAKRDVSTVAIVDDDQAVCRMLAAWIARLPGFRVDGFYRSGKDALAEIRVHPPDILLVDLIMAGMPGLECARSIDALGLRPSLIFMTGFPDTAVVEATIHFRGASFLVKPFRLEQITEALEVVADGGLYLSPSAKGLLAGAGHTGRVDTRLRNLSQLTPSEVEVLSDYGDGLRSKEIADKRGTATHTVQNQMSAIRTKLGVHRSIEAVWKLFGNSKSIPRKNQSY